MLKAIKNNRSGDENSRVSYNNPTRVGVAKFRKTICNFFLYASFSFFFWSGFIYFIIIIIFLV